MAASKCIILEAKSLQSVIKELHGKMDSKNIQVPSWRYPGKNAIDVNIESELKELGDIVTDGSCDHSIEQRLIVLELLIDRIMLLLQSILVCSSSSSSHIPLSFTTVFRKLIKLLMKKEKPSIEKLLSSAVLSKPSCCTAVDRSCQTLNTSFNVCTKCSRTIDALSFLAQSFGNMVYSSCGRTMLAETEWLGRIVDSGQFKETNLKERFLHDQRLLDEYHKTLECTISANQDTINCQEETISGLETNCSDLRNDVLLMEEKLESAKRSHQKSFIECNESFDECRRKLDLGVTKYELLLKESRDNKRIISELKENIAIQGDKIEHSNALIQEYRNNELSIRDGNYKLTEQINDLETQLKEKNDDYKEIATGNEKTTIELKKTKAQVTNINKKSKSLLSQQTMLVTRIQELDSECSLLNEQIEDTRQENINLDTALIEMTNRIERCEVDLTLEKENKCQLIEEKCCLEQTARCQEDKLKEAIASKELLMHYPYTNDVNSLQNIHDNIQCINANTARILLLEKQNTEIRKKTLTMVEPQNHPLELKHPVRLWQTQTTIDSSTNKIYKGRLGQLVTALSSSQHTGT